MSLEQVNQKIKKIKTEPYCGELREEEAKKNPFDQFIIWFDDILSAAKNNDPTAMVLATVDKKGFPDSRVVLLKELEDQQFIFYSNYNSKKAEQLAANNTVAINFYWPDFARQVRIKGTVKKVERAKSEAYFATRPREAQLGAQAWIQSSILANRNAINQKIQIVTEKFADKEIPCPEYWGGYAILPFEYEFFQGEKWRRHDRLLYTLDDHHWQLKRLAP